MEQHQSLTCLIAAQEAEKCINQGNLTKGVELLEKAIEIGTNDLFLLSAIYSQLGNAYYSMRKYSKAMHFHMNDFYISNITSDLMWASKSLANLATTSTALHRYEEAKEFAENFLVLAKEKLKDKKLEGRAYYLLGHIYMNKVKSAGCSRPIEGEPPLKDEIIHDLNQAIEYFKKNISIAEEMGDTQTTGFLYGNLGNAYYYLGSFHESYDCHQKRLKIAREIGDKAVMRKAYVNLGNNCVFMSLFEEAMIYYRRALELARESSNKRDEAQVEYYIGQVAFFQGDYITAIESHSRHLKLARELGDLAGEARANLNLANDFVAQEDAPKALYFLIRNYCLSINMGDQSLKADMTKRIQEVVQRNSTSIVHDNEIIVDPSYDPETQASSGNVTHVSVVEQSSSSISLDPRSSLSSADTSSPQIEIPSELREIILASANIESPSQSSSIGISNPDCGLTRNPLHQQLELDSIEGRLDDDLYEIITRAQSKRIDDQRCDPSILKDSKNTKFSTERQSDTINSSHRQHGTYCKVKRKVTRRLSQIGLIRPRPETPESQVVPKPRTSTPLEGKLKARPKSPFRRLFSFKKKKNREISHRLAELSEITQDSEDSTQPTNVLEPSIIEDLRESDESSKSYNPDAILDLICSIQSRRMEDQRAVLPGLQQAMREEILGKLSEASRRGGSNESLIDERLYNLILEYQSNRIEDQRSSLGSADNEVPQANKSKIPEEDITDIVNRQQVGRINSQRANPPSPVKPIGSVEPAPNL